MAENTLQRVSNQAEFDAVLPQIRNNTCRIDLDIYSFRMNEQQVTALASALAENTTIRRLTIRHSELDDDGTVLLAEAAADHPSIQEVILNDNAVTAAAMPALVDLIERSPRLLALNISRNPINDEGSKILAPTMEKGTTLAHLDLSMCGLSDPARRAFSRAVMKGGNTNLQECFLPLLNDIEWNRFLEGNKKRGKKLHQHLLGYEKYPDEWMDIAMHQNSIAWSCDVNLRKFVAGKYKELCDALPEVDISQPSATEALLVKQGDYSALDNPRTFLDFSNTLTTLNQNGLQLQPDTLLDDAGEPTAIFEKIIKAGKASALFTEANWHGAGKKELHTVLRKVPKSQHPPNKQALLIRMGRQQNQHKGLVC